MLNVLIVQSRFLRNSLLNLLDLKTYGIDKTVVIEDFSELPFFNIRDVDFIISDIEKISASNFNILNQISEIGLNTRLILTGYDNDADKINYILSGGIRYYEPDVEKFIEKTYLIFDNEIKTKEKLDRFLIQIHNGTFVKKIKLALEKGDSRALQKILLYIKKILPASIFYVKEYYLLILDTVFEFAEEKGVNKIDRMNILSELMSLTDFESVKDYAIKKVNSVVHLIELNKNNQTKMVAEYIKDFIDENYMKQDTNAGNIAERFGVSGSYIGSLFREQQKTTITKYITQLRIEKAIQLLSNTKLQIQAISKMVGYSDQNYFARIFKKQTGLSPGEYRDKYSQ